MSRSLCLALSLGAVATCLSLPSTAAETAPARGAKVYAQYCAVCHGRNMTFPVSSAIDLRAFPADQHARFVNSVIKGKGTMPAWEAP